MRTTGALEWDLPPDLQRPLDPGAPLEWERLFWRCSDASPVLGSEDTSKGVIHGIPEEETQEDIEKSLVNERNPGILHARRMGKTNIIIIAFEGQHVPHYVFYRGAEYRCLLASQRCPRQQQEPLEVVSTLGGRAAGEIPLKVQAEARCEIEVTRPATMGPAAVTEDDAGEHARLTSRLGGQGCPKSPR
ncbi:hypothetical protein HPB49_022780 [Dermacentor silvarum]|uniref:Uncharacterized protein n=1 Tax=Dermacentor silvarum TaxID=543639 RepID=A0ACB8D0C2_DERSI|nr:hypothetical protein HPB49_022780 [Dermacentor silvarum]